MSSFEAIYQFLSDNKLLQKRGPIKLRTIAINDDKTIYNAITECMFSEDPGYDQIEVSINWNVDNDVMHGLGLHASYNTNFQYFEYDDNALIITDSGDSDFSISLSL